MVFITYLRESNYIKFAYRANDMLLKHMQYLVYSYDNAINTYF